MRLWQAVTFASVISCSGQLAPVPAPPDSSAPCPPIEMDCSGQRYRGYCLDNQLVPTDWGFDARCVDPFKVGVYGVKRFLPNRDVCGKTYTETGLEVDCCEGPN